MKNRFLYILAVLVCACGGGDDSMSEPEIPIETLNTAPTVPSKIFPLNNTLCIDNSIDFKWNPSTDIENDRITYKIEISDKADFTNIVESKIVNTITQTSLTLAKGKAFYWRVKAIDAKNKESNFSEVSQFLTEGDGVTNHLPFAPVLGTPALNSVINTNTALLTWTASDADNDALRYDVYFDTANIPLVKVSENQTASSFTSTNLTAATTYFFKVVVKDGKGGQTIGPVWSFKTQ